MPWHTKKDLETYYYTPIVLVDHVVLERNFTISSNLISDNLGVKTFPSEGSKSSQTIFSSTNHKIYQSHPSPHLDGISRSLNSDYRMKTGVSILRRFPVRYISWKQWKPPDRRSVWYWASPPPDTPGFTSRSTTYGRTSCESTKKRKNPDRKSSFPSSVILPRANRKLCKAIAYS